MQTLKAKPQSINCLDISTKNWTKTHFKLLADLVAARSIAPADDGAIDVLCAYLQNIGVICEKLTFSDANETITNLYAQRIGSGPRHIVFAGHSDVVPAGNEDLWNSDPFTLSKVGDLLIGRGLVDMKGAIVAFIVALEKLIASDKDPNVSFLISGNEEVYSTNGMIPLIEWVKNHNTNFDLCILGEPTSKAQLGDLINYGRRGSVNFKLEVLGIQGHVAYRENFDNPITKLVQILQDLKSSALDRGNEIFQESNLEIVNVETDNSSTNVVPSKACAYFNIRFNNLHTFESLESHITTCIEKYTTSYKLIKTISGVPFYNKVPEFEKIISDAVHETVGVRPQFTTDGGITDARFIAQVAPVLEIGLLAQTAHQVNECVTIQDLQDLSEIYFQIMSKV